MSSAAVVRPAREADVSALVQLRMVNADRHLELDPGGHRRPPAEAVHRHFLAVLQDPEPTAVILVAEVPGPSGPQVAGLAELVMSPPPPDHQILVPRRTAQIHTVVLPGHRSRGLGRTLARAAERTAAEHGVAVLIAPILAGNDSAVRFYTAAGYRERGILLSKEPGLAGP